jgi:anhydro-N-acetylmuramic acid kinase
MANKNEVYNVIGLMSGTSLDGLDIAYCQFQYEDARWLYKIVDAQTIEYQEDVKVRLQNCMDSSAEELNLLDLDLGELFGTAVAEFIQLNSYNIGLVSSHGHTVLHQPERGITLQIGHGGRIKEITGLDVINDFRSEDVRLGGQGAPLVPIGDKELFANYTSCVNLGGIANISFDDEDGIRRAYDICGCNLILNLLSEKLGKPYDDGGRIARSGKLNIALLEALKLNTYLSKPLPKSLGKEDVWFFDLAILNKFDVSDHDKMRTYVEYIAVQLAANINKGKCLLTGGGAFNTFLIERLNSLLEEMAETHIPSDELVNYKEAMVFAFLGILRKRNEVNVLSSVTGASRDSCSGEVVL